MDETTAVAEESTEESTVDEGSLRPEDVTEQLVEEVSIDGMCGVY